MQVRAFLERYPPFDALERRELDRVVGGVEIEFFPAGSPILLEAGEPAGAWFVVRTGAVELLDEGGLVDLLGEGESFGHASLLSGLSPAFEVRAHEDSLCYLLDADVAEEVLGSSTGLAFLAASLRRRALRAVEASEVGRREPQRTRIGALIRRAPISVDPGTSVREAAALMARERISSLLIFQPEGLGIVTDRDLRTRVLAEGRSPQAPVREILSSPVVTISADSTVDEALLLMLDRDTHHVPVTGPDGSVMGVVTDTDLMGLERTDAFAFRVAIERARDHGAVAAELTRLPDVVGGLVHADLDPVHIGDVIAIAIDAATRRLIELSVADQGDPPCAWAWLAFGSQARHEQALQTDQDHGLAFHPIEGTLEEADRYFAELARRVTDGLEAGGIERCRGNVMAENQAWRRTADDWAEEFRRWMVSPPGAGTLFTSIALDYRRVAGPLDVERSLDDVVRQAPRHPGFVRRLGRTAIEVPPPTGFFRDLVVDATGAHAGTLDVKSAGITPLTNLARAYAASSGLSGTGTLPRLRASIAAGRLDERLGRDLADAFRLLWRVRLEHQTRQARSGLEPDDHVDPASLGTIDRGGLKEAFRTIARAQRDLSRELGLMRR
jgi:CBS domain-containing protein